jgi:hypothetical protein
MKLPRGYLSYSQIRMYWEDPKTYWRNYVLGIRDEPNQPMKWGKIVHRAIAEKDYDYASTISHNGFTSDRIRVLNKVLDEIHKHLQHVVAYEREFNFPNHKPCGILGIMDAITKTGFYEFKTGSGWNQKRVDEDDQLTFYSLLWKSATGKPPKIIKLIHISDTGRITILRTKRTLKDLANIQEIIEKTYSGISEDSFGF